MTEVVRRRRGRPRIGEPSGNRAAWWKEYKSRPDFKKHRREYMQKRRENERKAKREWSPATEPPEDDLVVLVALENCDEPVWLGFHDKEGWYLVDGDPAKVTYWMPRPKAPDSCNGDRD